MYEKIIRTYRTRIETLKTLEGEEFIKVFSELDKEGGNSLLEAIACTKGFQWVVNKVSDLVKTTPRETLDDWSKKYFTRR